MDASPFLSGFTSLIREELPDFVAESVEQAREGRAGLRASTILESFARQYFAFFFEDSIWVVERGYRTLNQLRRYSADGQPRAFPFPQDAQDSIPAMVMAPGIVYWGKGKSGSSALMISRDGDISWQNLGTVPPFSDQVAWRAFWPRALQGYQPGQEKGLLTTLDSDEESGTGGFQDPHFPGRLLGRKYSAALALDMSTGKGLVAYWPPAGAMPTTRGRWDFARVGQQTIHLDWTQVGPEPSVGILTLEGEPLQVVCRELWHDTLDAMPRQKPGWNPLRSPARWPLLNFGPQGPDWSAKYVLGVERHRLVYRPATRSLEWDMRTGPGAQWEPVRPHEQWSLKGLPADVPPEYGKAVDWGEVSLSGHPGLRMVWAQCLPPRVVLSFWIGQRALPIQEVVEESSRRADLRWVSDGGSWGKWSPASPETRQDGSLVWSARFDQRSGGAYSGVRLWSELELVINPASGTARWATKSVVDIP